MLAAAEKAFATEGLRVPLDEIARCAGVGAGTVYRHFPTKEALFDMVVTERLDQLAADAELAGDTDEPGMAFFGLFTQIVERAALNRALWEALGSRHQTTRPSSKKRLEAAFERLLSLAQEAGFVRDDVDAEDVRALLIGCMSMGEARGSTRRMTELALDALRPAAGGATHLSGRAIRNSRNETSVCEECGSPLEPAPTGRRARYCGAACRQRAHRRRTRGV